MNKADKRDIEDILSISKEENKKYLDKILRIKHISSFDTAYIMSTLNLSDKKIKLIEYTISKYSKLNEINSKESINEYIFEIVKNIEKLEKTNDKLLSEITECKNEIDSFKKFLTYILEKNIGLFKINDDFQKQNFVFSTIYIDK